MSYTLRRKMFKLGGPVNTHGVGITSNLKMNKGGKVAPIGSNVYPKVKGPDGQMREGHYLGMLAPAAALARSGAGLLSRGLGRFSPQFLKNFGSSGSGVKNYISGGRLSASEIAKRTRGKGFTDAEKLRLFGKYGFGPQGRGMQTLRGLGTASTAGVGIGGATALADRAGLMVEGNDDTLAEQVLRGIGRAGLDYSIPGVATAAIQALRSTEKDPKQKSLFDLIAGNEELKAVSGKETIDNEEEAMKTMTDKANARASEIYKMLGGGQQNKMLTASRALAAATPFVAEGEYGKAAAAAGESLAGSGEEDKKIAQEAALMTIEELKEEEQLKAGVVAQLMGAGEVETAMEAERAYESGKQMGSMSSIKKLPLKADGKHDTATTQTGVVYTDLTNLSGKLFIAYNSDEEPIYTNDYQTALNHSKD